MLNEEGIKGNYRVTGTQRIRIGLSVENSTQQNEEINSGIKALFTFSINIFA